MSENNKTILDLLSDMDKRIVWLVLLVVGSIPFIIYLGLPIPVSKPTQELYNVIETIPEGSTILFHTFSIPSSYMDQGYGLQAMLIHIFRRPIKFAVVGYGVDYKVMFERALANIGGSPPDKVYGVDYVVLGMYARGEPGLAALAEDMWVVRTDFYGTPLEEIPLMENFHHITDWDMIIDCSDGGTQFYRVMRIWAGAHNVQIYMVLSGATLPMVTAYYPDMIPGYLGGARGSAEYENLVMAPGRATVSMDSVSMIHIVILFFIILGNIGEYGKRIIKGGGE